MISILPEHAPESRKSKTLKLIVADDVIGKFLEEEATLALNAYAEDFCTDIAQLASMGPLKGKIDAGSVEIALNFMVVTYDDEQTEHDRYTEMFRKLVKQKFYWNIL